MQNEELEARWTPAITERINREIMLTGKNAVRGSILPKSPFGILPTGNDDYRQFPLREAFRYARLSTVDFSGLTCEFAGAFIECDLSNCVLDGATITGRYLGKHLTSCSLVKATLRGATLGQSFIECDFSKANLSKTGGSEVKFVRCSFADADLRRAHLMHCVFENCVFDGARFHNGSLAGSSFIGTAPSAEQFGNTILDHVKLQGVAGID